MSNISSNGVVRWDGQSVSVDDGALPGLQRLGFVRSVRTPQFDGITFHEILCKSALNKVPAARSNAAGRPAPSMLPFSYTVNGYRGCSHACRYCFARPTHEYLDLDCGTDFDTQVVVKTNVADVLSRYRNSILHVQIADPPGRGAPGTGTLDFEPLFRQLADQGYDGRVGLEYVPTDPTDSATSFGWL